MSHETSPRKYGLMIALAISLCLNLFFVGFAVGRRMHGRPGFRGHHPPHAMHHPGMELGPRGFLRGAGLGDAGPEVERIIGARREALRGQRAAIDTARGEVASALRAQPFEAQRFADALAKLQHETTAMQTQMHGAFVDVCKTLTPAQREKLARAPWFGAPPPP